jgi:peptide alpha-N-acetyltransferase
MKRNGVTEVRLPPPPPGNLTPHPQVVLETEFDNIPALSLYESLGFIREKRLYRFYLNGKDAFRLVLTVPPDPDHPSPYYLPIRGPLPAYPIDDDDDDN